MGAAGVGVGVAQPWTVEHEVARTIDDVSAGTDAGITDTGSIVDDVAGTGGTGAVSPDLADGGPSNVNPPERFARKPNWSITNQLPKATISFSSLLIKILFK